jgi:MerR family transcriptional regulator/heat shock protein HspR
VTFHGPRDPVYTISVAARLLGVGPSFLRQVEGEGLVCPARTDSNIRLYSDEDLRLLSRIVYLCRSRGVNLHGVRVILAMEDGKSQYAIAERSESVIALGPGIEAEADDDGRGTARRADSRGADSRTADDRRTKGGLVKKN